MQTLIRLLLRSSLIRVLHCLIQEFYLFIQGADGSLFYVNAIHNVSRPADNELVQTNDGI